MTSDQIATAIKQKSRTARPVLLGVEGFGGSGKTTSARHLADERGSAHVVSLDAFIFKYVSSFVG